MLLFVLERDGFVTAGSISLMVLVRGVFLEKCPFNLNFQIYLYSPIIIVVVIQSSNLTLFLHLQFIFPWKGRLGIIS